MTNAGARLNTNTELRYMPYGVTRYTAGTTPTSFNFTGQRRDSGSGLLFYNARWYDPVVGRFLQADSIVPSPGNPQSLNRYAYVLNNPLRYTDPTGHWVESAFDVISLGLTLNDIRNEGFTFWNAVSLVTDVASVALPVVPAGASHAIRAGKAASKAINAVDTAGDTTRLLNAVDNVADTAMLVNSTDTVADAAKLNPKGGVYTLRDVEGNVQRSGRTRDLARREAEHGTAYPDLRFQPEFRSDSYQVQRGGEQILHDRYNPPLDKINPISLRNPRRTQYLDAARDAGMQ